MNSTLAMLFTGVSNYSRSAINAGTDNWGIEVWAYPTTSGGNRIVLYNGNTGTSGFGIVQSGSSWALLYGGVILQPGAPVTLNQYADIALVRDSGTAKMFVNGVAYSLTTLAPNPVTGSITLGGNQSGLQRFEGVLDEARIFTFVNGFNPNDLWTNQPVAPPPPPPPPPDPPTPPVPAGAPAVTPAVLGMAAIGMFSLGLFLTRRV